MGQKVHPVGFRVGVYRPWDARWFARRKKGEATYGQLAIQDIKIREYLESTLDRAEISHIEIERAGESVRVIIHSARPGMVIGKRGAEIDTLRKSLAKMLNIPTVDISVQEVSQPELDATVLAKNIADQLVRRVSFKKAMKRAAMSALRSGAKGVKICCKGRLGGAEIAREEWVRIGSVPLHTLRSDIDYGYARAKTTFGIIGVKVWLCRGEFKRVK